MTPADHAEETFRQGFNCAQSVLVALGERHGLDRETALRVGEAFGGGIARMGMVCGAVTGALMAIGLRNAKLSADDTTSRPRTLEMAQEFRRAFLARNSSLQCRDLLGYDISTPDGHQRAADQNLFRTFCPRVVRDAAEIMDAILSRERGEGGAGDPA